jgi:hypothetical protein
VLCPIVARISLGFLWSFFLSSDFGDGFKFQGMERRGLLKAVLLAYLLVVCSGRGK